jgi:hypothetical protein
LKGAAVEVTGAVQVELFARVAGKVAVGDVAEL